MNNKYFYFIGNIPGTDSIVWSFGLLYNTKLSQLIANSILEVQREGITLFSVTNTHQKCEFVTHKFREITSKHFKGNIDATVAEYRVQLAAKKLLPMFILPIIAALPTERDVKNAFKEYQKKLRREENYFFYRYQ